MTQAVAKALFAVNLLIAGSGAVYLSTPTVVSAASLDEACQNKECDGPACHVQTGFNCTPGANGSCLNTKCGAGGEE
jgi:hypothetical protein